MRLPWQAAFLLALTVIGPARGEQAPNAKVSFTVSAGAHDSVPQPVRVSLLLPRVCEKTTLVALLDAQNKPFATGQLARPSELDLHVAGKGAKPSEDIRRELYFILPSLKAGQSLRLHGKVTDTDHQPKATGDVFTWHDTPGQYDELRLGSRPVLRYEYRAYDPSSKQKREPTYKVFHHVYDPEGKRLVTKGPGGLYTHHRGLFYGFRKVRYGKGAEVDIWHCTGDTHQAHEKILSEEAGPVFARQRLLIAWHGKNNEVFAREVRELTAYNVPGGRLIEFASRLQPTNGPVKLDGDPQHAGFHFRADNEVASKTSKETIFIRPDGVDKPGATRNWPENKKHVNLPWDAMSFVLGGQRYTVAYLDRPTNPKEARYSERNYGRFGSYFVAEATKENPVTVDYAIWLQKGQMTPAEVAARSRAFVHPATVKKER